MIRYYITKTGPHGDLSKLDEHPFDVLHIYGAKGVNFDFVEATVYGYTEGPEALPESVVDAYGLIQAPVPTCQRPDGAQYDVLPGLSRHEQDERVSPGGGPGLVAGLLPEEEDRPHVP